MTAKTLTAKRFTTTVGSLGTTLSRLRDLGERIAGTPRLVARDEMDDDAAFQELAANILGIQDVARR